LNIRHEYSLHLILHYISHTIIDQLNNFTHAFIHSKNIKVKNSLFRSEKTKRRDFQREKTKTKVAN